MIIISHNLDKLRLEPDRLKYIIKGSAIEYVAVMNELQDDITHQFQDILNRVGYNSNDIDDDWRIFCLVLRDLKTVYSERPIISNYEDSITALCENLPNRMVASRFSEHLLNGDNVPKIIRAIVMTHLYEQLVFYEYIYMSENMLYSSKIIMIIESDYQKLMDLLSECHLDPCTEGPTESKDNMLHVYQTYFGSDINIRMFRRFEEFHEKYLDYYGEVSDNATYVYYYVLHREEHDFVTATSIECLELIDLCYLDTIYLENPGSVSNFIKHNKHLIDTTSVDEDGNGHNTILLYRTFDTVVRMMEADDPNHKIFDKRVLAKILSRWMTMSSPSYCFHQDQTSYPYLHPDHMKTKQRVRDIVLSQSIKDVLTDNNYCFSEIGYVLTMDRLDMFMIIARHLKFRTIHIDLLKYMSPKIIDYVVDKCLANHSSGYKIETGYSPITINPYNLADRTPNEIAEVCYILNEFFDSPSIEYESVTENYGFVECVYVAMYWIYRELCEQIIGENILTFIGKIDSPYQNFKGNSLEFTLLRAAIDSISKPLIKGTMKRYFEQAYKDKIFAVAGPDTNEIKAEFSQYSVPDNDFIEELAEHIETIQKTYEETVLGYRDY